MAISGCSLQQPPQGANESLATVGVAAPDFSGTDLDGKPIRLSDFRGHPLLINFWASWCGPCRAEQPGLNNIVSAYGPKGLKVLGIDVRDTVTAARIHRDEFKVGYPSVFDQAARLGYSYQVDAPPGSVFVDAAGVVRYRWVGGLGEDSFRRLLADKLQLK